MEEMVKKFISNPEDFILFRGENKINQGGLHFTTDEVWAKNFGDRLLVGKLPVGSRVKLLTQEDFTKSYESGLKSEKELWNSIFESGWDAIIGVDSMNNEVLDIIINPKHLGNFSIGNLV